MSLAPVVPAEFIAAVILQIVPQVTCSRVRVKQWSDEAWTISGPHITQQKAQGPGRHFGGGPGRKIMLMSFGIAQLLAILLSSLT